LDTKTLDSSEQMSFAAYFFGGPQQPVPPPPDPIADDANDAESETDNDNDEIETVETVHGNGNVAAASATSVNANAAASATRLAVGETEAKIICKWMAQKNGENCTKIQSADGNTLLFSKYI
jgi:hypothetical protein